MDAGLPNVTNGNLNAYQMTTAVDFSTSTTILVPGDMTQFTDIDFTPTVQLAVTDTVVVNPAATNSAELLEKLNKAVDFIGNVQADGKITITARHLLDSPYKFPLEVADGGTLRRTATQVSWTFDVNAAYPLEYTTYSGIIPDPFPGYYDPTSPPPLLRPTFLINLGTNKHPIRYAAKQNIIVRIISDPFTTRMPLTISNWTLTKDFWTGSGEDAIVFVVNNNDAAPILEGIFQVEVSVLDPAYQLHPESEGGDPLPIIISEVVDLDVVVIKTSSYISKNNPSLDGAGCLLFGDKTFNGVDSETGMVYCQIEIDNHDADGTLALFYGREHLVGRVRHEVPVMVKIMMFGRNELPLVEGEYDLTTAVDGSATGPGTSASLIRGVTGIRILHPNDIQRQEG
jgi:hypothetical protein